MRTLLFCTLLLSACSSSNAEGTSSPEAGAGGASTSTGGKAGSSNSAGGATTGGATGESGNTSNGGKGGVSEPSDASTSETGVALDGSSGRECTAARGTLLGSIDSVSTGDVTVIGTDTDTKTLYVDGTAGGPPNAPMNPWIFVSLATASKVSVTDTTSLASTDWDLAIKRPVIYTNSGDGGPGQGGAVLISKEFDSVAVADARTATFATESFFDADCNARTDPTGAALTTFSSWYSYDESTHVLSPADGTWLVRGATGKLYKLKIDTYYGMPDGGTGMAGGNYILEVGEL
ncbi:MAG TPA: HmuY family protein [Polyangiaceae bacterium]|nr:HmuY family protein [Polyangiaceae bacterium]